MSPFGIHSPLESYYPPYTTLAHSPQISEPLVELPSNHLSSPQDQRTYTPIAPLPSEASRSYGGKRPREEDEETLDELKRRKRSDSNGSAHLDLSEEDRLLLQLKEEECMPWKDIAARFQSDLGKTYQIPALQMRLKRLRERMRVWTEADVRALRMAHEFWVQNKFDIISQKVSMDHGPDRTQADTHRCSNTARQRNGQHVNVPANGLSLTRRSHMQTMSLVFIQALARMP